MARVLLIDHLDSFTYNIADLLHRVLGHPPTVWRHDHRLEDAAGALRAFDAIVVGPGPGRPQRPGDLGLSRLALQQRAVPVLGICLGHQGLAHLAGDDVVELAEPRHGRISEVLHDGTGIFQGVPSPFAVVRYHSLEVRPADGSPLVVTARAADDGAVMAVADPDAQRWGVQFHPESVLSEHGERLVANFLRMSRVQAAGSLTGGTSASASAAGGLVAEGDVHGHIGSGTASARPVQVASRIVGGEVDTWALHQRLFADSPTAFWLDASGSALGQLSGGTVDRSSAGTVDRSSGTAGLPASAPCSVLGDASGPLSYVLTHRVGSGTQLSTGEHLDGPLLANLAVLRSRLVMEGEVKLPTAFRPGFVGYLGYELKAETDGAAEHVSPHPDARLVLADRALVVDHAGGQVHAVWLWDSETRLAQEAWVEQVREVLASAEEEAWTTRAMVDRTPGGAARADGSAVPTPRHTQEDYLSLIAQCQKQIRAGESYEICLTNAATWPQPVDETRLAAAMRAASPVPFAAWLRGPGPTVLSASPERFVSMSAHGLVEARPIKGTRPRGADQASDAALAEELRTSVKDRAENLMIVDLLRNDLHRVCRSGSVHVPGIFEVESYATVHQLVSTVRGRLAEGMDCLDVIGTCFPGGSMTGAPKVRTMQILDRLEGGPRGVYSGALGWIGLDGAMDLSIVIRTVTLTDGVAEFGVGGAITALSDPEEEYAETLVKAAALTRALGAAQR